MIMKVLNHETEKLKLFADWLKISKIVKRAINQGEFRFAIDVGEFSVTCNAGKGAAK